MHTTTTSEWNKDTAVVFAVVLLLFNVSFTNSYVLAALVLLGLSLLAPVTLRPLGWIWFRVAYLLRFVVPLVLFTFLFYVVLTPIGAIRRVIKRDMSVDEEGSTLSDVQACVDFADTFTKPY